MNASLDNKKLVFALKVIAFVVLISFLLNLFFSRFLQERLEVYINSIGIFGPLILIFYMVISHVFAPLAGAPAVIIGYTVFGVVKTSVYVYFAGMASAVINFYIARKFGRRWIIKFVGKKSMEEIDNYVESFGIQLLIVARTLGFTFFELISYASGLTNISFKKYMLITSTFVIIPMFVLAYFFKDADFYNLTTPAIWIGVMILVGIVFTLLVRLFFIKKSK